jgi:hypothetical protein
MARFHISPNARKPKTIADRGTWPASLVATGAFRP